MITRLLPWRRAQRGRCVLQAVLLMWPAFAMAAEPTLCTSGERVYFSCQVATGKVVSLCGLISEMDSAESWLQYRFGRPRHIELAFPTRRRGSLTQFSGESRAGAGVRLHSVEFTNRDSRYQIESSYSSLTGDSFLGVRVTPSRSQQPVELPCTSAAGAAEQFESLASLLDPTPR